MKIVAFVPLKLNNERLSDKNIKSFDNGKPLMTYILETLRKIRIINEVFVFCSQDSIRKYLPPGVTYLTRSETLDSSTTKINEVIESFVNKVDADIYILAHATAPFLSKKSIIQGIDAVLSKQYDSAFSVQKLQEFLWDTKGPINYDLTNIPRTQDLPLIYSETTGLYIFTEKLLKEHKRRIGFNPYMIEVSKIEAIDINTYEDFFVANAVYNEINKNDKNT
ncbi:MAG: acylneuraminate cytidylyltransferase family protein [Bacteroidales bacterium]|jgi:CMP-N-acetylneuraminic acid synthetase|nr:acylneuraminate cytidylyltransferase family protein [Bacteroidales bacterium]